MVNTFNEKLLNSLGAPRGRHLPCESLFPPLLLHYANAHQLHSVGASFRRFACQRKFYLKPTFVLLGFTVLWELQALRTLLRLSTLGLLLRFIYLVLFMHFTI